MIEFLYAWMLGLDPYIVLRELIGFYAASAALTGGILKGNLKKAGWLWTTSSAIAWFTFGCMIGSPSSMIFNVIGVYIALRGYLQWKKRGL